MTIFVRRPMLRWLVPLLTVVLLAAAGSAVAAIGASASGWLPPRTAAELLADVQQAQVDGLSGTVVQTADLGLPELPGIGGGQSSSFNSLVSGSHTLRVWYDGPQRARIALLGQLGESDAIRNGSDLWIWSSHDNTAQHFTVPADSGEQPAMGAAPEQPMTPQQAADRALKAITPSTRVTTAATAQVAGRSAYELVLEPRDPATLVGSVRIAIDGATHIPTRVQVFARGATTPSLEVGFTSFDPSPPSSSVFAFNPPPGAKVTDGTSSNDGTGAPGTRGDHAGNGNAPEVVGSGWTSVVTATLPSRPTGTMAAAVRALPEVSGSWGTGHLLHGTLFSVLVTDDGHVAAGAVAPERLYAALATK